MLVKLLFYTALNSISVDPLSGEILCIKISQKNMEYNERGNKQFVDTKKIIELLRNLEVILFKFGINKKLVTLIKICRPCSILRIFVLRTHSERKILPTKP
jgi:hypothetical protein